MIQTQLKLDKLFPSRIPLVWQQVMEQGTTKVYPTGIVANGLFSDVRIILSKSIDDTNFTLPMIRDIIRLITSHDKVAIETTRVLELKGIMLKLNMTYNTSIGCYVKG